MRIALTIERSGEPRGGQVEPKQHRTIKQRINALAQKVIEVTSTPVEQAEVVSPTAATEQPA